MYDGAYYQNNGQLGDRPALWYYQRLARRLLPPGKILDFGCGTGFFLKRLSRDFEVAGFEVSDFARQKARLLNPSAAVWEHLKEVPRNAFAGVTALHVFEHLGDEDLQETVTVLYNSLVKGGRMLCVMPDPGGRGQSLKGEGWSGFRDPSHVNLKSGREWKHFLGQCGFFLVVAGSDGLWDNPYGKRGGILLDRLRFSCGTLVQYLSGQLMLAEGAGESLILVVEKRC